MIKKVNLLSLLLWLLFLGWCINNNTSSKVDNFLSETSIENNNEAINQEQENNIQKENTSLPTIDQTGINNYDCISEKFATNLYTCTPSVCSYIHPLGWEKMIKTIKLWSNGTCIMEETMPNNGLMTCSFNKETRELAAQYYLKILTANSIEFSAELASLDWTVNTNTTIDNEKIDDVLNNALNNGTCIISWYEDFE